MSVINRTEVRKLALDYSLKDRNGKFTRVSEEYLSEIERLVIQAVRVSVRHHPTKGKTLTEMQGLYYEP